MFCTSRSTGLNCSIMKERIKQYMDYKSISAMELSSLLEVQRSNISHILNGRNKPGASFIEKMLVKFPDLNARWLFTGEGEMINNATKTDKKDISVQPEVEIKEEKRIEPKKSFIDTQAIANTNKPIDRVVVLFSDGTFVDFNKR